MEQSTTELIKRIKTNKKTGERYTLRRVFCCMVKGKPHYKFEKTYYCIHLNCNNEIPDDHYPKVSCREHDLSGIAI